MIEVPGLPEYVRGYRNAAGLVVRAIRRLVDRCEAEGREPTVLELEKLAEAVEDEAHPANVEMGGVIDAIQTHLNKR